MPLYMGGCFVGSKDDATKPVGRALLAGSEMTGDNVDNITLANTIANGSILGHVGTLVEAGHVTQAVRVDGYGTKYYNSEKRKTMKKRADERMWTLKMENYSDKEIAKKLEEELGVVRQAKSIASRLPKLQRDKQAEEDQRLNEESFDWQVIEDEKLYQAYGEVEANINTAIAKLEAKRWNDISRHLASKMPKRKFTGNACKERFEGLLDGSAELPIELDQDQKRRQVLREARIAGVKQVRQEAVEAAKRADEAVHQKKEAEKMKVIQIKQKKEAEAAARKAEQELEKELKKAVQDAKSDVVRKRRENERQEREKTARKDEEQELENLVHVYYTGRYLQRRHRVDIKNDSDEEDYVSEDERVEVTNPEERNKTTGPVAKNTSSKAVSKTEKKPAGPSTAVKISKQSLLNPRSILTLEELDLLLAKRDLPRRTAGETHPQIVARIAAADKDLKMDDLDNFLGETFASRKGTHKHKVVVLQNADAKLSAAGQRGVEASDLDFKKQYEGYIGNAAKFMDEDW